MAHNKARAERFKKRSLHDLERIRDSGSLSAAAVQYEIDRRNRTNNKK